MQKERIIKYTTVDEQIEKLLSRGLEINDLCSAREKLTQYGYYNIINSYKKPYLIIKNNHKHFKKGTSFDQLFSLFIFDHNLRNAILSAMLALEEHTKALAAEVLSSSFGTNEEDYLQWKNFRDRRVTHKRFGLDNTLKDLRKALSSEKDPIKYYRNNYGFVPPWILFKGVYFSTMVNFVRLFKEPQKNHLIRLFYNCSDELFQNSDIKTLLFNTLSLCLEYRNLAAHGGRVYNYIPNATVKLQHPDTLLPLAEDIHELIETQGLPLLLNTLSLLSYKEPFEIIDRTLHEELNRHLTLYEKDVDILGETLNLTLYKDQPNCMIIDGKEYPFISRIQSGLPGVKLIDAPDDLIDFLSNRLSDNTDN